MDPADPKPIPPELEIVPVGPSTTEEDSFWKENIKIPLSEILRRGLRKRPSKLPN